MNSSLRPAPRWSRSRPPTPRHVFPDGVLSEHLNLLAASPALWPAPGDWGEVHRVCGAFNLPDAVEPWVPRLDLREFLSQGEVVFLSLGSSEQVARERARELLVQEAQQSGLRCLIQLKSDRAEEGRREGVLYYLPREPHVQLFKHCSAIVHHGGEGTTHTAAQSGRPSIVLRFVSEQADWGRRLHAAAGGVPPRSFWKATSTAPAQTIKEVVADVAMRRSSQALADRLALEDGCAKAVKLLEQLATE